MTKKLTVAVIIIVIASLSVCGCSTTTPPSPTPTPTTATSVGFADYSSYYDRSWESSGMIITQPFKKSTNIRGDDVYTGVVTNTSQSSTRNVTIVVELTKSEAEAKQIYDKYVSDKLKEGFTARPDVVAGWKENLRYTDVWGGVRGSNSSQQFFVMYRTGPAFSSWEVTTQATGQ